MQTLCAEKNRLFARVRRLLAAAFAAAATVALSACTMPRMEGRAESERELSDCETALYTAMDANQTITSSNPRIMAYPALITARDAWLNAAVACPARFGEGVMRAARAAAIVYSASSMIHDVDPRWDNLGISSLDIDIHRAALDGLVDTNAAANAEERAGFALETLAARQETGASLTQSDRCKAAAQMLASLGDSDTREAVYDIRPILEHPSTIIDSANGLSVSTVSLIHMDCARALIETAEPNNSRPDSGNGTQPAPEPIDEAWRAYAVQTANHAFQAFQLGYPMFDEAIFLDPDRADD